MEPSENRVSRPAQITLVLRLAAGVYLMYLGVSLVKEAMSYSGSRQVYLFICLTVFFIAGAILGGWTLKKLIKGEFVRHGQTEAPAGDELDKES